MTRQQFFKEVVIHHFMRVDTNKLGKMNLSSIIEELKRKYPDLTQAFDHYNIIITSVAYFCYLKKIDNRESMKGYIYSESQMYFRGMI